MATATMVRTTKIDPKVLSMLRSAKWDENGAMTMPITKDRQLYQATAKVLEALGGKWNKRAQAHIFDGDGETAVNDAIAMGEYTDPKKALQFFETPQDLAAKIAVVADRLWLMSGISAKVAVEDVLRSSSGQQDRHTNTRNDARVLEPSAGKGRIISGMLGVGYQNILAVDVNPAFVIHLQGEYAEQFDRMRFTCANFLDMQAPTHPDHQFDLVVMNPPFTKQQDITHVRHAYRWLRKGGGLVAVTSAGWHFNQNKACQAFRQWLADVKGHSIELPDDTFRSSGTLVRTRLLAVRKRADET